jgi:hypothetical protein
MRGILLQKSKIEQRQKPRESQFLDVSIAAKLLSADKKVRGRFCVKRCGPSRRRARTASAIFIIFADAEHDDRQRAAGRRRSAVLYGPPAGLLLSHHDRIGCRKSLDFRPRVPEFSAVHAAFFLRYENIFHFESVPDGAFTRRGRDLKFIKQNQYDMSVTFRLVQRESEGVGLRFFGALIHIRATKNRFAHGFPNAQIRLHLQDNPNDHGRRARPARVLGAGKSDEPIC